MEPHKALAPTSPPAWQRQSHPPHAAAPIESQDPPSSSQQEALKSDAPIHAIPAPAYIDLGSVKAEKDTPDVRQQLPATSVASTPAPSLPSPANMYLGPPPPYSSHYPSQPLTASTTAAVSQNGTVVRSSPPMSRRDSREETASEQPRQSLPSISEALKLPAIYTQQSQTSAPHPPSFSQAAGLSENTHSVTSGSPSISRSHTDSHHASSLSSYSSQPSPHHTKPPDPIGHRPYPTAFTESPRPAYGQPFAQPGISPTDAQATQTPRRTSPGPNGSFAGPPQPYSTSSLPPLSAASYPPWPAYASTAGPAPAPPPFSQAPPGHHAPPQPSHHPEPRQIYPPGSGYSFPPPATSGLTYHQSLSAGAAQQAYTVNAELEKVDEQRRAAAALYAKRGGSFHGVGYGMTVKRHLDDFDLENSLNEVRVPLPRLVSLLTICRLRKEPSRSSNFLETMAAKLINIPVQQCQSASYLPLTGLRICSTKVLPSPMLCRDSRALSTA